MKKYLVYQKKYFPFFIVFLTIAVAGYFQCSQDSRSYSNVKSDEKRNFTENEKANTLAGLQSESVRIIKLKLLEGNQKRIYPNRVTRNIFSTSETQESVQKSGSSSSNPLPTPPPLFSYKLISIVRIHKSNQTNEIAVFSNGRDNVFVKEGEMIDPNFQLIKINIDHVLVKFSGSPDAIRIELRGN
jgi:hypothetical protein